MSLLPVPVDAKISDWPRRVANAINGLIDLVRNRGAYPFEPLDSDPDDPEPGRTYYNVATNRARTWDGAAWRNLW